MLMHVPPRHRTHFESILNRWLDGPGEVDLRPATYDIRLRDNGKQWSAVGYITKQMTPSGVIQEPMVASTRRAGARQARGLHDQYWPTSERGVVRPQRSTSEEAGVLSRVANRVPALIFVPEHPTSAAGWRTGEARPCPKCTKGQAASQFG